MDFEIVRDDGVMPIHVTPLTDSDARMHILDGYDCWCEPTPMGDNRIRHNEERP